MNKILDLLDKNNNYNNPDVPPIWLMRQAGRYLPEYQEVRKNFTDFLDLCYNSETASKITLQPIDRFNLDAAIVFSDILVIPHALNMDVRFVKDKGPVLSQIINAEDIAKLKLFDDNFYNILSHTCNTLKLTKAKLKSDIALIGFSGAVWTVLTYMLEGQNRKQDFINSRKFIYENNSLFEKLLNILINATAYYLSQQIVHGADVIQIFDSWAGSLSADEYHNWCLIPTQKIIHKVRLQHPEAKIIYFPRGIGTKYKDTIEFLKDDINGIGYDYSINIKDVAKLHKDNNYNLVAQGNLNPFLLCYGSKSAIENATKNILQHMQDLKFIFNLGHGVLQYTPLDNVQCLINYIKNYPTK